MTIIMITLFLSSGFKEISFPMVSFSEIGRLGGNDPMLHDCSLFGNTLLRLETGGEEADFRRRKVKWPLFPALPD
jgi:hypothetical protein